MTAPRRRVRVIQVQGVGGANSQGGAGGWPDYIPANWPADVIPANQVDPLTLPGGTFPDGTSPSIYANSGEDTTGWYYYSPSTGIIYETPADWKNVVPRQTASTSSTNTSPAQSQPIVQTQPPVQQPPQQSNAQQAAGAGVPAAQNNSWLWLLLLLALYLMNQKDT